LRVAMRLVGYFAVAWTGVAVFGQQPPRRATNIAALTAHPAFYHLRPIVVTGNLSLESNGERRLRTDEGSLRVVFRGSAPEGLAEVRGEFWDLGRMNADDPRLTGYDLRATFQLDPEGPWPRAGQVTAVIASAIEAATLPSTASIRSIVLFPDRYLDQKVTVVGQFAGRNLLGDLPDAPARSRYDFVLRSADSAIWVANMRPRGRDFELSLDARIDTGRWVEVSGILQQARGLQWLDAEAGSLRLAKPPVQQTTEDQPIRVPAAPPPEVVFSAPTTGETEVLPTTNVRVQFTRDIDPSSLKGRVRARYAGVQGAAAAEIPNLTTEYRAPNRVLEIRFPQPLEPFRTVEVELLEGVVGTDKQALVPWKLTFTTGTQ
jgi:hypothetical protein